MKMKRIALILLSLVMVFSTLVIVPVAAETASEIPVVDAGFKPVADADKIPTDKAGALTMAEFIAAASSAAVPAGTYVKISTPKDWQDLDNFVSSTGAKAGRTGSVYFYLTGDLDFNGVKVTPIGIKYPFYGDNNKTPEVETDFVNWTILAFCGTIDGNGYTIKNLQISEDASAVGADIGKRGSNVGMGLVAVAQNATFKNLVIDSSCSFVQTKGDNLGGYCGAGAVLGISNGNITVDNVENNAYVKGGVHAAGIIGHAGAGTMTISNCTNNAEISGANAMAGIVGWAGAGTYTKCVNNGTINGQGGIAGRARGTTTFVDCVNNGVIKQNGNVSGILGRTEGAKATLTNCVNTAVFNLESYLKADSTLCYRGIVCGQKNGTVTPTIGNEITINNCYSVLEPISGAVYAGYHAELVVKANLTGVANINDYESNTTATAFQITDATGLNKLSALVAAGNDFSGKTIYLANDINMTGVAFTPIGHYTHASAGSVGVLTAEKNFKGTFDGQGHTIDGIQVSYTNKQRSDVGLFGYAKNATIKNTILGPGCFFELLSQDAYCAAGAFVGRGATTVYNCVNNATVKGTGGSVTGCVGRDGGTQMFCSNYGTIIGSGNAGGFMGFGGSNVYACANYGIVRSTAGVAGGMIANASGGSTIVGCANYGTVAGNRRAAGMICARNITVTLNGCANYGTVGTSDSFEAIDDFVVSEKSEQTPTINGRETCVAAPNVGYDADLIAKVDLKNVVDITDIYEIVVDGTYSVDLYKSNGTEVDKTVTMNKGVVTLKEGKTDVKVMKISNAEGMRLFSAYINTYDSAKGEGKVFYLANDIDMSGYTYTFTDITLAAEKSFVPVGWVRNHIEGNETNNTLEPAGFKGIFNGLGYTIDNLVLKGSGANDNAGHRGIFGRISTGGVVTNLVTGENNKMDAGTGMYTVIGGIAATAKGAVIANVWNQMSVNNGIENSVYRQVGGVVGNVNNTVISNATNSAWISAMKHAAGIVGRIDGRATVSNCRNLGNIYAVNNGGDQRIGGIAGFAANTTLLINNENYGQIKSGTVKLPGAIVGEATGTVKYDNCFNFGNLVTAVAEDNRTNKLAGVYTDTTFALNDALTVASGKDTAYAEEMLKVWFQTNAEGDVRLVTTVDSLVYDKIVLTITNSADQVATVELTGVYTSILAGEITSEVLNAGNWGADTSKYFAALTITGAAGQTFTVQASAYIGETAVLTGAARTVVVD